ncbi:ketoacyl-ACP synthase III [Empedobacter stercoris]|uniref:3-oxoacyl-ACP synthase III family protein n=1 Tax=Empedobacter TaxID=59734 RepID=UPI0021AF030A|nr:MULTISPECIES: ketoacyl-ACP synthase III [Empedobacter]MDM1523512.1 ketoacyl-ACP synthase III [Empedobacter sp. 225-1]MDM1543489.1 ketoacyl-ACP synthase III [Empedobacter sp. 189-2]UWX66899.1 ketoacyl-ACP synthase III [Empedobacter stercoris]
MINSVITGSGHYLPNRIVTNEHFINYEFFDDNGNRLDKTGEEITRKFEEITEIRERRYVEDDLLNSDIATFAAKQAIEDAGINPEELDYIIVGHNFGDIDPVGHQIDIMPSISAKVKHNLGINNLKCKPYDMTFGCPGWIESLILGHQFIQANIAKKVLVIGSDTLSRAVDPHDRSAMIFADGAGAVVLEAKEADHKYGILNHETLSYTGDELAFLTNSVSVNPNFKGSVKNINMKGRKVYEFVLKNVPPAIKELLADTNLDIDDINKILLHQANAKMDHAMIERLYKSFGKTAPENIDPMTVQFLGNTSVATVPTMFDLIKKGDLAPHQFHANDKIILASVGATMNINALIYQFEN